MNYKVLTTANWLDVNFSDQHFERYYLLDKTLVVKGDNGIVSLINPWDFYYYGNVFFCENEAAFIKRFKITKKLSWDDPTEQEIKDIEKNLNVREKPRTFKRKDNNKGCDEYSSLLSSLKHKGFYPEMIDKERCQTRIVCNNCGDKQEYSFFEDLPAKCPCCEAEFLSKRSMFGQNKECKNVYYYTSDDIRFRACTENYPLKTVISSYAENNDKRTVIMVDDNQEKISIVGVTEDISARSDLVSKYVLNWDASYSIKEGVISRKIYSKGKYKDKDIIDLVLENIPINYGGNARHKVLWYGSKNASTFLLDNREFFEKIGFFDFVKSCHDSDLKTYDTEQQYMEDLMIRFVCLLGQYPVFEQIVKAGHGIIAAEIMKNLAHSPKKYAKSVITEWEKKLDVDSTSSKKALQLPKYVCTYLRDTKTSVDDYVFWMRNWRFLDMSKENFEEFVGDIEFQFLKIEGLFNNVFCNLVGEWGYNPHKLKRYLVKQCDKQAANLLRDYLKMSEDLGIEPDPYPYHLRKMHDDIMYINYDLNTRYDEEYVKRIQNEAKELVNETRESLENKVRFPADFKEYTALFPTKKQEFFNEGNAMHSCVGPYMRNVNAGNNIVFFIRKKENMADSYITAEWSKENSGVGQVLMSNNRDCTDRKAYEFATWVANTIQLGVDRGLVNL